MKANNMTVQELMPFLVDEINKDSDFEKFLDIKFQMNSINSDYDAYITSISNTNLCKTMNALKNRKELCEKLDSQISKKGILQVFHHNQDIMLNIMMKIVASDYKLSPVDTIGGINYRNWEYTFDNVYIPSYFEIFNQTAIKFDEFNEKHKNTGNFTRFFVVILAISMVICYYIVYKRLSDSSKRVAYCY